MLTKVMFFQTLRYNISFDIVEYLKLDDKYNPVKFCSNYHKIRYNICYLPTRDK